MKLKKFATPIQQWDVTGEAFKYEGSDRKVVNVMIGAQESPGGTTMFIVERIYEDLVPLIKNRKLTVHIDLHSNPKVVLEANGRWVCHNMDVQYLREDIEEILKEKKIAVSNQVRALVELRKNRYSQYSIGNATKIIRLELSEELEMGERIHYDLIRLILKDMYIQVKEHDLSQELSKYTKEELLDVAAGVIEYRHTQAVKIKPLKDMVEDGIKVNDVENALKEELLRRYLEGSIH